MYSSVFNLGRLNRDFEVVEVEVVAHCGNLLVLRGR